MEKKSKKSLIIGITALLLVTLTLLGLTYAYYRTRIVGNENDTSVSVTSKKLEIVYEDDNAVLTAEGVEPGFTTVKDFLENETDMKMFTVTSNSTEDVAYSVVFENIENGFVRSQDWTYTIYHVPYVVDANGNETDTSPYRTYTGTISSGTKQIVLPAQEATYHEGYTTVHKYWIGISYEDSVEDQSVDMGKSLSFKINIAEDTLTWDNAETSTTSLLYNLKSASDISTTMGNQVDDYGISYYYTGAVTNNYVNYSGMCWRIVRVQGDGSIKLVLADENNECNGAGYNVSNTISAFIDGKTDIYYKATATASQADFVFENSDIPGLLDTWSKREGKVLDTSKLVEAEWCNDTTISAIYGYDENYDLIEITYEDSLLLDEYSKIFHFGNNAGLKCNAVGLDGNKATIYSGYIGILTESEVYYAKKSATDYYLKTNAAGSYWTMTPSEFRTNGDGYMYTINASGGFATDHVVSYGSVDTSYAAAVRPSIVLRSDVILDSTITGQNGTQTNPYVIG